MMKQLIILIIAVFGINMLVHQAAYAQDGGIAVSVTDVD